jgi:thymidylate kinase
MKKHSLVQNKFEVPGTLIVVEGIDGSGKSTQIKLLEKWLRFEGMPVFLTEGIHLIWSRRSPLKGKRRVNSRQQLLVYYMQLILLIDTNEIYFPYFVQVILY